MEKKRLIVIDGNAIIHRAYHALPKLTTKSGKVVNAVYGFLLTLFRVLKDFKPDFIIATFDFPAPTFRDKIYKEYKAQRPKAPDDLYQQIPEVKKILEAFGIKIFELKGFEADDLIGTITRLAKRKQIYPEIETIIVTGDLDTLQLIDPQTKVFALRKGIKDAVLYDREKVKERYDLEPEQLVDFKALRGDPSDNIPGVPGIGEKTAISLIQKFGSLENLYQALDKETPRSKEISEKIKEKLKQYKEQAFFSKKLAEIRRNVPIDFRLKDCRLEIDDLNRAKKALESFEFLSLVKRLPEIFQREEKDDNSTHQQRLI
ncbi:hypothetical protein J7L09_00525 [bacterium]|nr:hypothetical protein [bacterium]